MTSSHVADAPEEPLTVAAVIPELGREFGRELGRRLGRTCSLSGTRACDSSVVDGVSNVTRFLEVLKKEAVFGFFTPDMRVSFSEPINSLGADVTYLPLAFHTSIMSGEPCDRTPLSVKMPSVAASISALGNTIVSEAMASESMMT